tara:strand:- start:203 stop:715 length:513 start_codon:yes stop_codon:yes gene_type:complete
MFGVMIGGIDSQENVFEYNEILFRESSGSYVFDINGINFRTLNSPKEIEGFGDDIPSSFWNDFSNKQYNKIYLDFSDSSLQQPTAEFYSNIAKITDISTSCNPESSEKTQCLELPLKSCDDADDSTLFVEFVDSEENAVSYSSNCLYMSGSSGYLTGVVDYIVMGFLGVF